jgi:hypothetical protein
MKDPKHATNKKAIHEAGYPTWSDSREARPADASRRRFIRQVMVGGGALCLAGVPRLSHGQSTEVDFSVLEHHRSVADQRGMVSPRADAAADVADSALREQDSARSRDEAPADPTALADANTVTEQRALWVQPGYLLLLRWTRPDGDDAPVAALEGAADEVATFLAGRVTTVDNLHNLEQLRPLEADLAALLAAIVAPAVIEVLHLDHDCNTVCSALGPSVLTPEPMMLRGDVAAPGWE